MARASCALQARRSISATISTPTLRYARISPADERRTRSHIFWRSARLGVSEPCLRWTNRPTESQAKVLFRGRARHLLPLYGRTPIRFDFAGPPQLSVIMVLHDEFALTLMALASLRDNFSDP